MEIKIAPSILAADFSRLKEEVVLLEKCGADLIHCDVMDGNFVPPITFGAQTVMAIRPHTRLPLDCHLMTLHPGTHIDDFVRAGANIISVHVEACGIYTPAILQEIQSRGVRACAVINPETRAEDLFPTMPIADMVLVMSVHPGWGGQKFIPESIEKIRSLRTHAQKIGRPDLDIEVDGGINEENVKEVIAAGANVIVAGSAIFSSPDKKAIISRLRG